MSCNVQNNSNRDMSKTTELVNDFFPYAQKYMQFSNPVSVNYESNEENASDPLGKTAYYEPSSKTITIFVDGRHAKDILRSLSHELVHHKQNERGEFKNNEVSFEQGYAQTNKHMRNMEQEAYQVGNMCFRDWTDMLSTKQNTLLENTYYTIEHCFKRREIMNEEKLRKAVRMAIEQVVNEGNYKRDDSDDSEEESEGHSGESCDEAHPDTSHDKWAAGEESLKEWYGESLFESLKRKWIN